jgi:hypothetical protein
MGAQLVSYWPGIMVLFNQSHRERAAMSQGTGKYDDLCTEVRESAKAEGAIVVVVNGDAGSGFSIQMPKHLNGAIAGVLEHVAEQLRKATTSTQAKSDSRLN